jgi:ribose transport system permease protein
VASSLLLVALFAVDAALQPALLNLVQIGLVVQIQLPLVFLAVGQTLVVLTGGIDLSVGATFVVANALCATWIGAGSGGLWKLVPIVGVGVAIGVVNGCLIAYAKLEPFIATLATWTAFDGVALLILPQDGGQVPTSLVNVATGKLGPVPDPLIILACALCAWVYVKRTRFGLRMYALGSDAARLASSGSSISKVKLAVYGLAGLWAALGGIYLAASTGTGTPTAGDGLVLPSVAAVVIGGTSLRGARGDAGLTIIGVFVLGEISNITQDLQLPAYTSVIASALALLIVVALRSLSSRDRFV